MAKEQKPRLNLTLTLHSRGQEFGVDPASVHSYLTELAVTHMDAGDKAGAAILASAAKGFRELVATDRKLMLANQRMSEESC